MTALSEQPMRTIATFLALSLSTSTIAVGVARELRTARDGPQSGGQPETCGRVVKVSSGCRGELQVRATNLSLTVKIPERSRPRFQPLRETYSSAEVCVAALPSKPGHSFSVEIDDPSKVRIVTVPTNQAVSADVYDDKSPGVLPPKLLSQVAPRYTREAMERKLQGDVELEAVVLANGKVGPVRLTQPLDPCGGLDDEAIAAARQWRFSPGVKDGQPVPVRVTLILSFRLH